MAQTGTVKPSTFASCQPGFEFGELVAEVAEHHDFHVDTLSTPADCQNVNGVDQQWLCSQASLEAQFPLHLFEWNTLGFGDHEMDPE